MATDYPTINSNPVPRRRRRVRWDRLGLVALTAGLLWAGGKWLKGGAPSLLPEPVENNATFLIAGVDKEQNGASRSDTLLIGQLTQSPERKVTLISLPRDTRVRIPGKRGYSKLNAAFATKDEETGLKRTCETISQNFGVKPTHTVLVKMEGVAKVVDALGGVEVTVPAPMRYHDKAQNLHIDLKPGRQKLNGQQALWFCRWRSDGRGDIGRVARQQLFLKELAKQALTPALLLKWGQVGPALQEALQTDLTPGQLLGLATQLRGLKPEELRASTLPGKPQYIKGVSYWVPLRTNLALTKNYTAEG